MKRLIASVVLQVVLLLLLLRRDRGRGKQFFREQPWTATTAASLILLLNAFQVGAYYTATRFPNIWQRVPSSVLHGYMALLVLGCVVSTKGSLRHFGVQRKGALTAVWLGVGVGLVSFGAYHALSAVVEYAGLLSSRALTSTPPSLWYAFRAVVAGPVLEEAVYRGMLYSPFRLRYPPSAAIAIVAVMFSLGHLELTIDSILVGLCWGALYDRTETIIAPVAAHSTYNLLWVLSELP